ncbi:MAG: alpha-amylase [Bryobacteraceae bacterium]
MTPPFVYELNTWVWLDTLSRVYGRRVMLDDVPGSEWDALAAAGMDAVWLMGIWERSPEGRRIAIEEAGLEDEYRRALPDYTARDVTGSPYSVHRYRVEELLGGPSGLAVARQQLRTRGLALILDFVPNHVAPDNPWVREPQRYFIPGDAPGTVAHGKDPYFPPWTDTAQVNAFSQGLRQLAAATVLDIAAQCDGVRCDMAMLVLNWIFQRTWGERAGTPPYTEYWSTVIGAVRAQHPEFLFLAEAYWDLEARLREIGFDYCYDKRLYDRLVHGNAIEVRDHLRADVAWQNGLIRFLENHDEPRAASTFQPAQHRAAAVVLATLPGAKLFFDGQFTGRRVKLPVQLGRAPQEFDDAALRDFYLHLLAQSRRLPLEHGSWKLLECDGWPDNQSCRNLLAWAWDDKWLIVVNYASEWSQGLVRNALSPGRWRLSDLNSGSIFERDGGEGLYVELPPWEYHWFELETL